MLKYGSENWALNRSKKEKIGTAEMRFLRPVSAHTFTEYMHAHVCVCTQCDNTQWIANILLRAWGVTIDGVWFGDGVYWTL
jgi:hypothetical protein